MKKNNKTYTAKLKKKLHINDKQLKFATIFVILFLILVIGATYAYFAITSVNNATPTTVTGTGEVIGNPTLTTNTPNLGINLTAEMMSQEKIDWRYYATPDSKGIGLLAWNEELGEETNFDKYIVPGHGKYELATVSLDKGVSMDCTYTYDISATTAKEMPSRDRDGIMVVFTDVNGIKTSYTLTKLINGVTYVGKVLELKAGESKKIYVESYLENTGRAQTGLVGNTYTINITPKSGTNGFKCDVTLSERIKNKNAAEFIATNYNSIDNVWRSGYEGDGYRYIGQGRINAPLTPRNIVCFGTTSKSDCTSNPDKYMYRIIGAFQEENGNGTINTNSSYHLKLVKKSSIGLYQLHNVTTTTIWSNTDLYKNLNGSYFLDNTNYDYMQNSTWRGKIADWNWTSALTDASYSYGGNWSTETMKNNYLHELNRSSKPTSTAAWSYINAKIGLMYVTDYMLSEGNKTMTYRNRWINSYQNDANPSSLYDDKYTDRYISSQNLDGVTYVGNHANVTGFNNSITDLYGVRPVFYLNSNVQFSSGNGTYENPFIIK